ncbi:hypothetical protein M3667_03300 [Microbacterium sp. P26]|uniref:ORC-CDC6 family AAA ATPase n=1 Tax=Microbacterium TaxID=33882 RepID=UPI00203C2061|nr:hypothetical protein [Microbacterium sp. P26]MCM3500904.1 hypothetical protein [Microbacterium sp. P26]
MIDPQALVPAAENARFRTPTVVARTFVPPDAFKLLIKPSHTVMVGPRGSGKTTLLKMLTPEALDESSRVKRFRLGGGLQFTGVFIPSSSAWSRQIEAYEKWGLDSDVVARLFESTFAVSVLRAFCVALHDRLSRSIPATWLNAPDISIDAHQEADIAVAIAEIWHLKLRVTSLLGVRAAAAQRIVDLGRLANELRRGKGGEDDPALTDSSDLVALLTTTLDTIEAIAPAFIGQRWCLLFDELELAPEELRRSLVSSMRSVDDRLIFKLALAPYSADLDDMMSAVAAMPGHDHDPIWLSYGHKSEALRFSYALMEEVVRERFDQEASLTSLLGDAVLPDDDDEVSYETRSKDDITEVQAFFVRELYESDLSFKRFVDRATGGIDELLATTGQARAQYLRKIIPLVIARLTFRAPDRTGSGRQQRYRTRKNPHIYAGGTAVATVLEGNPRWIIGLMNALLDNGPGRIPASLQTAELARARNRFRALLSTIPAPVATEAKRGLLPLLDTVGRAFSREIIANDFTSDPVGTFIVDSTASEPLIEALGMAVNTGAIVYVPDSNSAGVLTSMRGKRFRLSYLLATGYQLPLRLERAAALSAVLSPSRPEQLELFSHE